MTLPFIKGKKRKYQCFVCGVEFDSYEEFKDHILEEHEESREYIPCPSCDAPVRDLRAHYRIKHPQLKLPKDRQLRTTVWYDFTRKGKKTKKPSFKEGYLISEKNDGDVMHYRSGYELEVYECLEQIKEITAYEVEPKDCKVPYFHAKKWRNYWPDLKVQFLDGHIEIWEIKPSNQTSSKINTAKWDACKNMCMQRGYTFKVKTEKGIKELREMVLNQDGKH